MFSFGYNEVGVNIRVIRLNDTLYTVKVISQHFDPVYYTHLFNDSLTVSVWTDSGTYRSTITVFPDYLVSSNGVIPSNMIALTNNCSVQLQNKLLAGDGYTDIVHSYTGTFTIPSDYRVQGPKFNQRIFNFGLSSFPYNSVSNYTCLFIYSQVKLVDTSLVNVGSTPYRRDVYEPFLPQSFSSTYNYGMIDPNGDSLAIVLDQAYSDSVTKANMRPPFSMSNYLNGATVSFQNGILNITPVRLSNQLVILAFQTEKWRRVPRSNPILLSVVRDFQLIRFADVPSFDQYRSPSFSQSQASIIIPCGTDSFTVKFNRPLLVSSIDSLGSDWALVGSGGRNFPIKRVKVVSTLQSMTTPSRVIASQLTFKLSSRVTAPATLTLFVRRGRDGNGVLNTCGNEYINGLVATIYQNSYCPPIGVLTGASKDTITKGNPGVRVLWQASADELQDFQSWIVMKRIGNAPWIPVFQSSDVSVTQWIDLETEGEYRVVIANSSGYSLPENGVKAPQFSPKNDGSDLINWFELAKKLNQNIEVKNASGEFETVTSLEALKGNVELRLVDNSNPAFKQCSAVSLVSVGLKFNRIVLQDEVVQFPTATWIQIYDELGRLVYKAAGTSIQWSSSSTGIYFVKSDQVSGTIRVR